MNAAEKDMLEEFNKSLKLPLHKDCVNAYLGNPGSDSIVQAALERLREASDEAGKH